MQYKRGLARNLRKIGENLAAAEHEQRLPN